MTKRQLEEAAACSDTHCSDCSLWSVPSGSCAEMAAQTALAYRAMLERLEWNANAVTGTPGHCSICGEHGEHGHEEGCELAELLREE